MAQVISLLWPNLRVPLITAVVAGAVMLVNAPGSSGADTRAIAQMLPSQIAVQAGETTTVDVGMPVAVNYAADGWVVASNGNTISVTAPEQAGATADVSVSAAGHTATVTLVAVNEQAVPDAEDGVQAPPEQKEPDTAPKDNELRHPAAHVDTSTATRLEFEGEIHANTIVVKVPLSKASELLKYTNTDREGAKLRYVDINGNIIEGVQRDIDLATRTLTLTYPEGETPDNPFMMEIVRDDAVTEFIVVITSINAPVQQPEDAEAENPNATNARQDTDQPANTTSVLLLVAGTTFIVALAVATVVLVRRRKAVSRDARLTDS